ncbi:hypothetical protein LIER_02755 [Lithospermum erythrorhizon]|uniref:Uncharacterized protein n=1 Tax=Lithospermum erythrorhizon TaxID=34254 RepID=A0AAV3NQP3_LITER
MVIKVDLQCPCCYKKIKRILCKFPQIRNQVVDEKTNTVIITVVCCSPEKIRDKLCCKGGNTIQSIDIKYPSEKPKPEKPKEDPKPIEQEKPKEAPPPPPEPPAPPPPEPVRITPPPEMIPAHYFPPPVPTGYCCMPCYDGLPDGPCYHGGGYRRPIPPPPTYDYNYGKPCYVTRCDYFCEENPQGCFVM